MKKINLNINDLNLDALQNLKISIIGYGIQGRAQALNLRDSGISPYIGNIDDKYLKDAVSDNMCVSNISSAVKDANVIMMLVPDQSQSKVFEEVLSGQPASDCLIVVAHGYSIYHSNMNIPDSFSIGMLAPRMPGAPIRDAFLKGSGIPAFFDVVKDSNGNAQDQLIALAHAIGFTKGGLYSVPLAEETEIDLFIEQFYLPIVIHSARIAHDFLITKGLNPSTVLMELFASGEIGELLTRASNDGLYETWMNHASPTCRFGIKRAVENKLPVESIKKFAEKVLSEIRSGDFNKDLMNEGKNDYLSLFSSEQENIESLFTRNFKISKKL
ncbi:NAD(P)-binding domain-containing protein [Pelagibacteraceae bacterium]|nr:NAD(P)-binding domain-containing protein [Pelagibacteraceae bacterium]